MGVRKRVGPGGPGGGDGHESGASGGHGRDLNHARGDRRLVIGMGALQPPQVQGAGATEPHGAEVDAGRERRRNEGDEDSEEGEGDL